MKAQGIGERILRPKHLAEKLGCNRTSLYRWIDAGILPKPIRLGRAATGWRESDIDAWLAARELADTNA